MTVLTLEGVVENGRIELRDPITLAEHARVYVVVPDAQATPLARIRSPHLARPEQAVDFIKRVVRI